MFKKNKILLFCFKLYLMMTNLFFITFYVAKKLKRIWNRISINGRRKYYKLIVLKQAKSVGIGLKVNGESYVNRNTTLGNNVNFNGMQVLGLGHIFIGNNFHSGTGCIIITHYHSYHGNAIPYDDTLYYKDVEIGDNVWLGTNVTILGGVIIGEGAIIQIGSVVVSDIPPMAILPEGIRPKSINIEI
jgi:acetyltransferase-like isoleucine patch superfamily enzyme